MSVITDNPLCEKRLSLQKSAEAIVLEQSTPPIGNCLPSGAAVQGRAEHHTEVENWRVREGLTHSRKLCRYSTKPTLQRIG
jgi:hypothetical protein